MMEAVKAVKTVKTVKKSEASDNSIATEYIPTEEIKAIDSILIGDINRTLPRTNFLKGMTYEISATSGGDDGVYADNGNILTNGVTVNGFDKYNWVGFQNKSIVEIDFDFGEIKTDIADVETGFLYLTDYGIWLPDYVELSFSTNGNEYTSVSRANLPTDAANNGRYSYNFMLQNSVSAQCMKIEIYISRNAFFFIDEISAYSYEADAVEESGDLVYGYYPEYDLSKLKEAFWDKDEPDYNKNQNLALGTSVYISSFYPLPKAEAKASSNSPISETKYLTDGKYVQNPRWDAPGVFRFCQGYGREIIMDLEKTSAVNSASGEFIAHPSWGVKAPGFINIAASINGEDWQNIGTSKIILNTTKDAQSCKFDVDFKSYYKARFIKASFYTLAFVGVGEIEVFGTKSIPNDAKKPNPDAKEEVNTGAGYILPEDFGGINNILCTPICRGDGVVYDPTTMVTTEEFLPVVGYWEDDKLIDTFMDCFLISPCSDYTKKEDKIRLDGWKFYVNSQFQERLNIPALGEAAKIVGDGLGKKDYSVSIFMSLLRPVPTTEDGKINSFGDIDGDGKEDPLNLLENRKKALKWMVDTQLEMLEDAKFNNINLVGFYWQEEFVNDNDPDEVAAFEYIRDYIHDMGLKIIWIPYFNAQGFDKWKDFGFDLACLQPNYAFVFTVGEERLAVTAQLAKQSGMCVEIEMNNHTVIDSVIRYKQYLEYGVKYGYMDGVKVYYHDVIPSEITRARSHADPYTASIYRDTYLYAKGLLDENYSHKGASNYDENELIVINERIGKGTYKSLVDLGDASGYSFSLGLSPKYGHIEINPNGLYGYTPRKGFKGEDKFVLKASFIDGHVIEVEVNLIIE